MSLEFVAELGDRGLDVALHVPNGQTLALIVDQRGWEVDRPGAAGWNPSARSRARRSRGHHPVPGRCAAWETDADRTAAGSGCSPRMRGSSPT